MTKGDNMPLEFIEHPNIEEVEDTHTPSKEPRLDGTLCLLPLGQARASWWEDGLRTTTKNDLIHTNQREII